MALTGGPTVTLRFKGDADDLHRTVAGVRTAVAGLATAGVGLAGTVGVVGALGAAASAAVVSVAALPAAFLGIGIAAAAQTEQVKTRFTAMKDHVVAETTRLAAPIQAELLHTADSVEAAFNRIAPSLGRIFEMTAPHLKIFTDGVTSLVERAMPGFETAIANATPLVGAFARGLDYLGTGIGNFFAELSYGTPGAVKGMDALFKLTRDLLVYLGHLVGQLANSLGPAFAALEPSIMVVVRALGEGLLSIVQTLAPYVGTLGRSIAEFLTAALDAAIPVVNAILPLLAEFGGMLMDSVTPILRELGPVLAEVVRELADGLRPVIPVVAAAFREMTPTILEIARDAGPLLAEIIRVLAPLFLELVSGALDLTNALLPVIPPLLEMANNAMPLVAGVIKDVLIPVIKWLVTEFVGLIDYGVKIAESFADLSVRWRTYWDEIKAAFADADAKIRAGIEGFASLGETARRHWDAMYQAIKGKIEEIVAWAADFPRRIIDAIMAYVQRFYDAGASLIQGFADGIASKAETAKEAGIVTVQGVDAVFPQSPPPEGPFAGSGWTYYRGQSLIDGFVEGVRAAAPQLYAQITSVVGQAQGLMAAVGEVAQRVMSGGQIFEDFSYQGMSANLARYNDMISKAVQGAKVNWDPRTGSGSASMGGLELKVAPGADSALSSMLMNLVRTGQLQLARA